MEVNLSSEGEAGMRHQSERMRHLPSGKIAMIPSRAGNRSWRGGRWSVLICYLFLLVPLRLWSQEKGVVVLQTAPSGSIEATAVPAVEATAAPNPEAAKAAGEKPPGEKSPGDPSSKGGKAGEKAGEKAGKPGEGGELKIITRADVKPNSNANKEELAVRPDEQGKLRFNFHAQPWAEVLEWLAAVSKMSLDWQELPGDYLNLSTQKPFTVAETRDLINRHLLARGFTILERDDVLTVVNLKKLNPALVPRMEPEELKQVPAFSFIKVSFPLSSLVAEQTVTELKPLLSPHGQITALKNTNRVEIIDAAINVRELANLLRNEQTTAVQERLVREFPLTHARASEIREELMALMGIEDKAKKSSGPPTPEQMQQQQEEMMMAQQRMQEMQQRGGQAAAQPKKDKPEVFLVVNARRNSLLANAPPDKMAIIEQAVKILDVPGSNAEAFLANSNRMQVYRLASLDPETLVKSLNELRVLEPATKLQVDKKNHTIIAYASLADQMTIRALVAKLDGSGRKFEVIPLRRLPADYVAGSIDFMMGGAPKEKKNERRNYFYGYDPYGGNRQYEDEQSDKFRVDADVEHNRLLIWANPIEMDEVRNLLVKLGEIPDRGNSTGNIRVLNVPPGMDRRAFLEQLQKAWPHLAPNPLLLPQTDPPRSENPAETNSPRAALPGNSPPLKPAKESPPTTESRLDAPATDNRSAATGSGSESVSAQTLPDRRGDKSGAPLYHAVWRQVAQAAPPANNAPAVADQSSSEQIGRALPDQNTPAIANRAAIPPVRMTWGYDNQILISSDDPAALDALEDLLFQIAPPRVEYKMFQLKYASAFWVAKNLEDYFKTGEKKPEGGRHIYFYDEDLSGNKTEAQRRLSQRRPLKFIDDLDTNTILVTGADAGQLKTIEELIRVYDKPDPVNAQSARVTTVFTMKYAKALVVADAVKDVYRDLLSSNDKALQGNQQEDKKRPTAGPTYIINEGSADSGEEKRTQVSFKGKLSLGVDEYSNTLLVSTEGENLMQAVAKLIEALDESAKPVQTNLRVVRLGATMDSSQVRAALTRAINGEKQGNGLEPQTDQNPMNPMNGQNQQRQGRPNNGQNGQNGQNRGPQRGPPQNFGDGQ